MSSIDNLLPVTIDGIDSLVEIALDMHWSWCHSSDHIWRKLDAKLWELTQNPWLVLQTVARDKLEAMLADPVFRQDIDHCTKQKQQAAVAPTWFSQ